MSEVVLGGKKYSSRLQITCSGMWKKSNAHFEKKIFLNHCSAEIPLIEKVPARKIFLRFVRLIEICLRLI